MFTLLLAGRSHVVSNEMAHKLLAAMEAGRAYEWIEVEMNGEGSGFWRVAVNVQQVSALVEHPAVERAGEVRGTLRLASKP